MKRSSVILSIFLLLCAGSSFSQNQAVLNDGLSFANSLKSNSSGQIVNPSAVNQNAWNANGASSSVPSSTPGGMGSFSTPTTSSNLSSGNNFMGGLSGLGTKAMSECEGYIPTGDKIADQRCAAINFMSAHCLSTSSAQNKILGASAASQSSLANCADTYGSGSSQFDYKNTVTPSDPVFKVISDSIASGADVVGNNCKSTTVVDTPAKYQTNICVKSTNVDAPTCNYTLSMSVVNGSTQPTVTRAVCPSGDSFSGPLYLSSNVSNTGGDTTWRNIYTGAALPQGEDYLLCYYSGGSYPGSFDSSVSHGNMICGLFCAFMTPSSVLTCPDNATLASDGTCQTRSVTTKWVDGCTALEKSAGSMLGAPTP